MAQDPFPNTAQGTLEQRLNTLYQASHTVLVLALDPLEKRNGLMWLNTSEQKLKIYQDGITWEIGKASAVS